MRLSKLVGVLIAVASAGAGVRAQTPTIVGAVRDSAGVPIGSAEITVLGRRTVSDSLGRFSLTYPASDTMTISVRRLGYESVSFTVTAQDVADNSLDVVLRRVATTLDDVNVEAMTDRQKTALRGYDDRRERGLGVFVTREEIEKRNTPILTDVLRQARGVMVRGREVRFTTYQAKNCVPMLWLDGQQAPGLNLSAISATDVEGVELYQSVSTTPAEFRRGNQQVECGTIVVWTRRYGTELRRSKP